MTTVELQCWGPCLHHWQGCIPCKADKSRRILWCKPSSHAWNSGQNHPTCHIRCSTFCINVLHQRCHDHDETRWYHSLRESPWSKSRQHPAEQACHLSKLLVCVCVCVKKANTTYYRFVFYFCLRQIGKGLLFVRFPWIFRFRSFVFLTVWLSDGNLDEFGVASSWPICHRLNLLFTAHMKISIQLFLANLRGSWHGNDWDTLRCQPCGDVNPVLSMIFHDLFCKKRVIHGRDKHLEMCKKHLPESFEWKRDVSTFFKSRHWEWKRWNMSKSVC